ncbi:hypothetical protein KIPB_015144, partial [Kipferlia bialata]
AMAKGEGNLRIVRQVKDNNPRKRMRRKHEKAKKHAGVVRTKDASEGYGERGIKGGVVHSTQLDK